MFEGPRFYRVLDFESSVGTQFLEKYDGSEQILKTMLGLDF